jgi:hypothetical protein
MEETKIEGEDFEALSFQRGSGSKVGSVAKREIFQRGIGKLGW